jgi:flagellar biosynthesis component FlhA
LQQLIPTVVIQQAHETLLQAQQDLVLLAAVTPGMPKAAAVPSGAALVRAATHIPSNATPAMMWTQAQAQAMQQQQQQQQVQAQQQQMQVVLVAKGARTRAPTRTHAARLSARHSCFHSAHLSP